VTKDKALADTLRALHVALNALLAGMIVLHVAATVKHHFVDRDSVLARMLPIFKRNAALRP
jgi:cytochrome b561